MQNVNYKKIQNKLAKLFTLYMYRYGKKYITNTATAKLTFLLHDEKSAEILI